MNIRAGAAHVLPVIAGLGFAIAAIYSAVKGSIRLRAGSSIEKIKDPVGFWGAIFGLLLIGVLMILFWATR
jgi:hypothetical protein